MPSREVKAKSSRHTDTKAPPKGPYTVEKAAADRGAPVMARVTVPAWMAARAASSWYTPEVRITRAVTEQTQMVAMNTSKMPHMPCSAGSLVLEAAWAMAEVPMPASLVNTPRATP